MTVLRFPSVFCAQFQTDFDLYFCPQFLLQNLLKNIFQQHCTLCTSMFNFKTAFAYVGEQTYGRMECNQNAFMIFANFSKKKTPVHS